VLLERKSGFVVKFVLGGFVFVSGVQAGGKTRNASFSSSN
jgi:hypothetical protein